MKWSLRVLDHTGHTSLTWQRPTDLAVKSPQLVEAERVFNDLFEKGYSAIATSSHTRLTAFSPTEEEVVLIPAIVGG